MGATRQVAAAPEQPGAARATPIGHTPLSTWRNYSIAGMTSFDALEAIQAVTGDTVALRVSKGSAEPRDLVLKRAFTPARDPVKSMLVDMPGGKKAGYIRLTEFTSQVGEMCPG